MITSIAQKIGKTLLKMIKIAFSATAISIIIISVLFTYTELKAALEKL